MNEKNRQKNGSIALILVFIASILFSVIFSAISQKKSSNIYMDYIASIVLQAVMFLTLVVYHFISGCNIIDVESYKKGLSIKEILLIQLILVLIYATFFPLSNLVTDFLNKTGYNMKLASGNDYLGTDDVNLLFLGLLSAGVIAPLVEESIFRVSIGYNYRNYGFIPGALLSALLFGLMHGGPAQFVFQFGLGLVACAVYYITKSFWSAFMLHSFSNSFLIIMMFIKKSSGETGAVEDVMKLNAGQITLFVFLAEIFGILLCLAIYLLFKVTSKKNGMEKTFNGYLNEVMQAPERKIFKNDYLLLVANFLLLIPWMLNLILGYIKK